MAGKLFDVKNFIATILCYVFIFTPLTNYARPLSQPTVCPSVNALKRIQVLSSDLIEKQPTRMVCCDASGFPYYVDGTWDTRNFSGRYDTKANWEFSLGDFRAKNAEQALATAQRFLTTLTFAYGPYYEMRKWYCAYNSTVRGITVWYLE